MCLRDLCHIPAIFHRGGEANQRAHWSSARIHIINAFSMCNADGSQSSRFDMHAFRGHFTPEFYPRRFALKDSLYRQRLDVLTALLQWALKRYRGCEPAVSYVEFSIGAGDIRRAWVLDVLTCFAPAKRATAIADDATVEEFARFKLMNQVVWSEDPSAFTGLLPDFPWLQCNAGEGIVYRLLAAFNRDQVLPPPGFAPQSIAQRVQFIHDAPSAAIQSMLAEMDKSERGEIDSTMFNPLHLELDKLEPTVFRLGEPGSKGMLFRDSVDHLHSLLKESSVRRFFTWVVGLDWVGDEMGAPFCAFVSRRFLSFIRTARLWNPHFGVRIHGAENVPVVNSNSGAYRLALCHMYIVFRTLEFLQRQLGWGVRLGHGVAFASLLEEENPKLSRKSAVLHAEMWSLARHVLCNVPFELNLTSNHYLLSERLSLTSAQRNAAAGRAGVEGQAVESLSVLDVLCKHRIPVILSTDDHGVWPIDACPHGHLNHVSLAAEYCRAIMSGWIRNLDQLQVIQRQARFYCFSADDIGVDQFKLHGNQEDKSVAELNAEGLKALQEVQDMLRQQANPAPVWHPKDPRPVFTSSVIMHPDLVSYLFRDPAGVKSAVKLVDSFTCWHLDRITGEDIPKLYGNKFTLKPQEHFGTAADRIALSMAHALVALTAFHVSRHGAGPEVCKIVCAEWEALNVERVAGVDYLRGAKAAEMAFEAVTQIYLHLNQCAYNSKAIEQVKTAAALRAATAERAHKATSLTATIAAAEELEKATVREQQLLNASLVRSVGVQLQFELRSKTLILFCSDSPALPATHLQFVQEHIQPIAEASTPPPAGATAASSSSSSSPSESASSRHDFYMHVFCREITSAARLCMRSLLSSWSSAAPQCHFAVRLFTTRDKNASTNLLVPNLVPPGPKANVSVEFNPKLAARSSFVISPRGEVEEINEIPSLFYAAAIHGQALTAALHLIARSIAAKLEFKISAAPSAVAADRDRKNR